MQDIRQATCKIQDRQKKENLELSYQSEVIGER